MARCRAQAGRWPGLEEPRADASAPLQPPRTAGGQQGLVESAAAAGCLVCPRHCAGCLGHRNQGQGQHLLHQTTPCMCVWGHTHTTVKGPGAQGSGPGRPPRLCVPTAVHAEAQGGRSRVLQTLPSPPPTIFLSPPGGQLLLIQESQDPRSHDCINGPVSVATAVNEPAR